MVAVAAAPKPAFMPQTLGRAENFPITGELFPWVVGLFGSYSSGRSNAKPKKCEPLAFFIHRAGI
jgi:hypothetical protein